MFSVTACLYRLGLSFGTVNKPEELDGYGRYIIPGVGHAGEAMRQLQACGLSDAIKVLKKPVLGICLGLQLLTEFSEEGNCKLLGMVPLRTKAFKKLVGYKVPHIGWNQIQKCYEEELFAGVPNGAYFYFVHSYCVEFDPQFTLAYAEYGDMFSASIKFENFYGLQFHPEKSGELGEKILRNFSMLNM